MTDPSSDDSSSKLIHILDKYIYKKLQHNNYLQLQKESGNIDNEYEII